MPLHGQRNGRGETLQSNKQTRYSEPLLTWARCRCPIVFPLGLGGGSTGLVVRCLADGVLVVVLGCSVDGADDSDFVVCESGVFYVYGVCIFSGSYGCMRLLILFILYG